jgi:ATP-dependent DNA helicase RecG
VNAGPIITAVEREAEISALGRALALERRARYIDFRGKRSTFSQFMCRTSARLVKRFPLDSRWTTLGAMFRQYPFLDLPSRMAVVRRSEELLFRDKTKAPPATRDPERKETPAECLPGRLATDRAENNSAAASLPALDLCRAGASPPAPDGKAKQRKSAAAAGRTAAANTEKDARRFDVQFLKGVGPRTSEMLARLNIKTVDQLLRHYPRQHLDFQNHLKIREVKPGEDVTILGTIRSVGTYQARKGNVSVLSITISDGSGSIGISRFVGGRSNHYLLERYKGAYPKGAQVMASGRVEKDGYSGRLQLKNAEIELLGSLAAADDDLETLHTGRLVPVYPLTEGLSLRQLRGLIHNALELFADSIQDPLPQSIKSSLDLSDVQKAFWGIHFPESIEEKEEARRRLVFDELLLAQLHLACRRHRFQTSQEALQLSCPGSKLLSGFRDGLPFKLTGAQERVFAEIAGDLASAKPMHRLVQGDVGSGKTVVAAMSALVAIENGYQVAVMAPTEILAEQHYRQFQKWLAPLGIRCALLLGKQGVRERRVIGQGLVSGQVHIAIGTHALIQEEVEFKQLGYVIIDEQHRFGVKQRASLKAKGSNPELLTMTATPIPRTLALTLHGDLDVSEIDELPPGRKPVETRLISAGQRRDLNVLIREQIAFGRQAYIVFPLIEESETLSARAATAEYERLRTTVFPEISIGLMHGRLKPQEKDEVMEAFRAGIYKILVSTTVIEVGVDVANATVMVIENADRFGLAQLHQLRGRVGRGADKSYCYLVAEVHSELTRQRLAIMTETNDGFVVAEKDLELRGPGEFLGVRQSGLPEMALADIVKDAKILELARKTAIEMVKADPELKNYPILKEAMELNSHGEVTDLITSG